MAGRRADLSRRPAARRRGCDRLVAAASIALLVAVPAQAQVVATTGSPRFLINVDGGYQGATERFTDQVRFRLHAEDSTFDAAYDVRPGPLVSVRGGVRVWRRLGVAVAMARYAERGGVSVTARLPHPFFFDRPRQVDGTATGFQREEVSWYVDALWLVAASDRLAVQVFGGPSYVALRQDLVQQVDFSDSYPYDTATFVGVRRTRSKSRAPGFSLGVDGGYFFTTRFGIGATLRVGRVRLDLAAPDEERIAVHGGGVQASGGLRLRF